MMDDLDQCRARVTVHSLSDEVLLIVFKFWQLSYHDSPSIVRLCPVCKNWWRLITNTASVHNAIWNPHPEFFINWLKLFPGFGPANVLKIPLVLSLRWFQGKDKHESHLSLVQQFLSCISVLNLEGPGACQLLKNNENNLASFAMTHLSLHNNVDEFPPTELRSAYTPDSELALISTGAPQLRSLSLQGYLPSVKSLSPSPLFSAVLVRLELVCVEHCDDSLEKYKLNSLLVYLYRMPSLRELILRRVLSEDEHVDEPELLLPPNFHRQDFDHLEKLVMEARTPRGMPIYKLLSVCLPSAGRHIERHFIMNAHHITGEVELPPFVDTDVLGILVASTTMLRLQFHGTAPTDDRPRLSEIVLRTSARHGALSLNLNLLLTNDQLKGPMKQVKRLRIIEQERPKDTPLAELPDLSTIYWGRPLQNISAAITHLFVSTLTHSNLEMFIKYIDMRPETPASISAIAGHNQPFPELTDLNISNECWRVVDAKKVIPPLRQRGGVSIFLNGKTLYCANGLVHTDTRRLDEN